MPRCRRQRRLTLSPRIVRTSRSIRTWSALQGISPSDVVAQRRRQDCGESTLLTNALERNGVDYHVLVARMKKAVKLSNSAKEQFRSELASARAAGRAEASKSGRSQAIRH